MTDREHAARELLAAARAASEVVLRIYGEADVGAELKGPNDPVTRADKRANELLVERLTRAFPGVPIVAEESDPSTWQGFGESREALFVDPIDGTREFIAKNGEFAVMIALAEEGAPTVGVVLAPATGKTWLGIAGAGAYLVGADDARTSIRVSASTDIRTARVAVSRLHRSKPVDDALARLDARALVPIGSAGLKGVHVAEGALEIYAHPSNGAVKLWDAGPPDAIVRAAGGVFTDAKGRPFDYRGPYAQGEGTLAANAALHAEALRRMNG